MKSNAWELICAFFQLKKIKKIRLSRKTSGFLWLKGNYLSATKYLVKKLSFHENLLPTAIFWLGQKNLQETFNANSRKFSLIFLFASQNPNIKYDQEEFQEQFTIQRFRIQLWVGRRGVHRGICRWQANKTRQGEKQDDGCDCFDRFIISCVPTGWIFA